MERNKVIRKKGNQRTCINTADETSGTTSYVVEPRECSTRRQTKKT